MAREPVSAKNWLVTTPACVSAACPRPVSVWSAFLNPAMASKEWFSLSQCWKLSQVTLMPPSLLGRDSPIHTRRSPDGNGSGFSRTA